VSALLNRPCFTEIEKMKLHLLDALAAIVSGSKPSPVFGALA